MCRFYSFYGKAHSKCLHSSGPASQHIQLGSATNYPYTTACPDLLQVLRFVGFLFHFLKLIFSLSFRNIFSGHLETCSRIMSQNIIPYLQLLGFVRSFETPEL